MPLHPRQIVCPFLAVTLAAACGAALPGCDDGEPPSERAEEGLEQAEAGLDQAGSAADEMKDQVDALEEQIDAQREAIRELADRQAGLLESELALARQRVANLAAEQEQALKPTLDETAGAITEADRKSVV